MDDYQQKREELAARILEMQKRHGCDPETKAKKRLSSPLARKNASMAMRIHQKDLYELKERALKERMPYQTLVTRLIRKYLDGELVMRDI